LQTSHAEFALRVSDACCAKVKACKLRVKR
jgi:hypothetical protein